MAAKMVEAVILRSVAYMLWDDGMFFVQRIDGRFALYRGGDPDGFFFRGSPDVSLLLHSGNNPSAACVYLPDQRFHEARGYLLDELLSGASVE